MGKLKATNVTFLEMAVPSSASSEDKDAASLPPDPRPFTPTQSWRLSSAEPTM